FFVGYIPDIRAWSGGVSPARLRLLAPGVVRSTIGRPDGQTLTVEPDGGYLTGFDSVFRDPTARPFRPRQVIDLSDVQIRVLTITADGRPARVAFQFKVPLEDGSLRWLQWERGVYQPFALPAVGQTIDLPAAYPGWP